MPGPPDGSCARAGEQRLLIHRLVRDGAAHAAPTSRSGREVGARTKYTAFLGDNSVIRIKAEWMIGMGIAAAGSGQLNPQNVSPYASSSPLEAVQGGRWALPEPPCFRRVSPSPAHSQKALTHYINPTDVP